MSTKNYITAEGYAHLKEELAYLLNKDRPDVVKTVAWAASNGDRSENADYIYGKRRLREIDKRIRFLTKRLDNIEVVNPAIHHGKDQIFFGATVKYVTAHERVYTVTIVGVDEIDPLKGKISWISPVARALMKAHTGDTITFHSPIGLEEMTVLEVVYPNL